MAVRIADENGVNATGNVESSPGSTTILGRLKAIADAIASAAAATILAAGENHIGQVGGHTAFPTSTPTLSVAGQYATGDYIGPSTTPTSFASAVRTSGGSGVLMSVVIADKSVTAAVALELWLFSATFTAPTDNGAWNMSDADGLNCIGVVEIPTTGWYASSAGKIFTAKGISLPVKCAATSLFYALVARGTTPTWTDGDLKLTLGILQD